MNSVKYVNSYCSKVQGKISAPITSLNSQAQLNKFALNLDFPKSRANLNNSEQEDSGNEPQSMVVIDDFDVEEELHKAQKEGSNMFKVLSMCFYEKSNSQQVSERQ